MKVDFTVPEQVIAKVKLGQPVRFGVTEADLLVHRASDRHRSAGRPADAPRLRAGRCSTTTRTQSVMPGPVPACARRSAGGAELVTVPQTAVIASLYGDYVYAIERGEAGEPGAARGQAGLRQGRPPRGRDRRRSCRAFRPGQKVVASGQNKLQAGATVKIDNSIDVTKVAIGRMIGRKAMSFTELFIRRPVLAMVVSLLILLLGAQGLMSLQVRQYPEVEETTITITTTYMGASADLMQGFISTPIAKAVSSAEGVDYVTSQSRLGVSTVSVRMRLNTDPNAALTEVTAKVQQVRGAAAERRRGSGDRQGHRPDLRADVPDLRELRR